MIGSNFHFVSGRLKFYKKSSAAIFRKNSSNSLPLLMVTAVSKYLSVVARGVIITEFVSVNIPQDVPKAIIQFESGLLISRYSFSNCVDHVFKISKIKVM